MKNQGSSFYFPAGYLGNQDSRSKLDNCIYYIHFISCLHIILNKSIINKNIGIAIID